MMEEVNKALSSKQETLEEAAERLYPMQLMYFPTKVVDLNEGARNIFITGAKWNQERSYSEEEVLNITQQLRIKLKSGVLKWQDDFEFDLEEWFEKFKK